MEELTQFLQFYLPPGTDLGEFLAAFERREVKKGKLLVKPGQVCDWIAYIKTGVFRVYIFDENDSEITLWLSFPDMVISEMGSYFMDERSIAYVKALEDGELFFIRKNQLEDLYQRRPEYRIFGQKFAEEALIMLMRRTFDVRTRSPEERYRRLLEQPEFMQKIPLKHLASWLGVTASSLSRIRRRVKI